MTVKNIVFRTSQRLNQIVAAKIKKSHIYELFAAAFNFNTYAALGSKIIFIEYDEPLTENLVDQLKIRTRCIELGYSDSNASLISKHLPTIIAEQRLATLNLNDLIAELRSHSDDIDIWSEALPSSKWTVDEWQLPELIRNSPTILKSLEESASSGNALAHYALAYIYDGQWNEDEQVSDYWFRQQQAGNELGAMEIEFAKAYAAQFFNKEKGKHHLTEAALLNNELALIDLAEHFDDPLFFDKAPSVTNADPMKIVKIAEKLLRMEDVHHWLIVAAETGNTQAMRELIIYFEKHDLTRCWTWIYLSKLLGCDLTKDRYFAMHEDGSAYDDDVGGHIELGGEGGISLPELEYVQDQIAKRKAEELFKTIEHPESID